MLVYKKTNIYFAIKLSLREISFAVFVHKKRYRVRDFFVFCGQLDSWVWFKVTNICNISVLI